ncbi:hypothetical protein DEU56DRAFT_981042 [Suillus clintonianus]|uniref:uncharacterized protein n=1 Tax=Suillus clintonianus TaxID=1904413 RepID=UPI001B8840F7|nr:uncharacterized protein DEU56DRAFT_981042 [Suillus clintonianus]KAG2135860.1 hypothetical protein DEU56DRAFT_981042 [Suillus clintonianus]
MAPPKWATIEEERFFQSHSAKYQACQAKRSYSGFWEPVFEEWFSLFPERLRVFKDVPLDVELTVEQKTEVGKAVEHRRQQIMNKFKNDMGSSKVNRRTKNRNSKMMTADVAAASTSLTPAVTYKKSMVAQMMTSSKHVRGPQVTEAFSKLFFDDVIKPTLDLAIETAKAEAVANAAAENTTVKMPSNISIIRKQTSLLYQSASDEVKQQVAEFIEEAKKKKKQEWEEAKGAGVVDHQVYIDRLPGVLTEFFDELQRLTGLVFTVLMGGPTPAMGGQIDVQSFHVGATEIGNQFDLAYPEFNSGIMRPWKEFVKRVFPVATAKEEGNVWGASRQPTLEPELWKESSDGHVSQTPADTSDGAFGNIPRDALTMASSSDILFPHISEPLTSFFDDDDLTLKALPPYPSQSTSASNDLTLKALPSYPSHSTSASTDLDLDGASSMLSVEGYHEFLRTYVAPQAIPTLQTPLYTTHGSALASTPPMPKPLTPAESQPPPLSEPTSAEGLPEAAPVMTDLINNSVDSHSHLANPDPQPLSESTSAETVPAMTDLITEDTDFRSHPQSLSKSTSAEAAPLIGSRSKRVRQISKRNEIANSIGSENAGSKKRGSSGANSACRNVSTLSFLSLRVYLPLETAAAASNADDMLYEDEDVSPDAVPSFSRLPSRYQYETHTHAPASSILYHIGKGALKGTNSWALELSNANARHWITLTAPQVKQKLPRLKISGGRITKA